MDTIDEDEAESIRRGEELLKSYGVTIAIVKVDEIELFSDSEDVEKVAHVDFNDLYDWERVYWNGELPN